MLRFLLCLLPSLAFGLNRWYSGDCGLSGVENAGAPFSGGRIVGGVQAAPHEFPYQVQVTFTGGHFCGGAIINEEWVLSAAHCFFGNPNWYGIVAAVHDITNHHHAAVYDIIDFYNHEDYPAAGNDITLVRINGRFVFDEGLTVAPICSPEAGNDYVGATSVASGWGATSSGGDGSDILLYTSMPVPTNDDCAEALRGVNYPEPVDSEICAGEVPVNNERDTCQGDSGGPLAVKEGDQFRLIGLTSHGFGCASGTPGVYARVTSFLDWIDFTLAQNS